jgi:hypothetical protein
MSWFSSFMHPGRGYEKGQEQLDKYYQQAQQFQQPYMQNGQNAYAGLNTAMGNLLDPEQLQSQWASGYNESPYAKQQEAMAQQQGLNAASSMGLMGSSPALQAIQSGTAGIVQQDRQQYLNDLMQKYLAGTGIGQNIYGVGANAANQSSQNAMNQGQNSAQMAFNRQNAGGNMFGNLLGAGLSLGGGYLNGGMRGMGNAMSQGANQGGWNAYGGR